MFIMKIEKFWRSVKEEISQIANLDIPEGCQNCEILKRIQNLDKKLNAPKIQYRKRGNYYYFYEMEWHYDKEVKEGRRKTLAKLGRISIKNYEINREKIKALAKEGNKEELMEVLEQY